MHHIYEYGGVMLRANYEMSEGVPTFHSVHLLDADYKPVGPNLHVFLHNLAIVHGSPHRRGKPSLATPILSAITEEIQNAN